MTADQYHDDLPVPIDYYDDYIDDDTNDELYRRDAEVEAEIDDRLTENFMREHNI